MINPWGWIGAGLVFVGIYLTGRRIRVGFIFGAIAELFWLLYAYTIGSVELGVMAILFVLIYLHSFLKWKAIGDQHENRETTKT